MAVDSTPVPGLVIQIANITQLALVTVVYNQELNVVLNSIKVFYDQRSNEPPIDFKWTLVRN
jgi:hypothetical protein